MIFIKPEQGIADQEVVHLAASVVKNERSPLFLFSEARIGVLVQMGAVEITQPVFVSRKMGRHPIENHSDAVLMQRIDQKHEVLRRAKATGRREIPDRLITPRAVERMFRNRQELHVRITHMMDVLGQSRCKFAVGQPAIGLFCHATPGTKMDFVDRYGRFNGIQTGPRADPGLVLPPIARQVPDLRCRVRAISAAKA